MLPGLHAARFGDDFIFTGRQICVVTCNVTVIKDCMNDSKIVTWGFSQASVFQEPKSTLCCWYHLHQPSSKFAHLQLITRTTKLHSQHPSRHSLLMYSIYLNISTFYHSIQLVACVSNVRDILLLSRLSISDSSLSPASLLSPATTFISDLSLWPAWSTLAYKWP